MYRTGPGFDPHNINLASVRMTKQPLEGEPLIRLYRSLQDKIAGLPGVSSAAIFQVIPFSGSDMTSNYSMPGGHDTPQLYSNWISPQYFHTMRIPLLAGRDFAWSELCLERHALHRRQDHPQPFRSRSNLPASECPRPAH